MDLSDVISICQAWDRMGGAVGEQAVDVANCGSAQELADLEESGQLNSNALRYIRQWLQTMQYMDIDGVDEVIRAIDQFDSGQFNKALPARPIEQRLAAREIETVLTRALWSVIGGRA